ncbi:hypothetical protein TNCV_3585601 [Trichonephila clavipes]|nr:hypothetical protein TNCV_3585601 [Trichonephila clavipes]
MTSGTTVKIRASSCRVRFWTPSRGVATGVSSVSMIRGPQATRAPPCVTTVLLKWLSYLKNDPEEILLQGFLRAGYASDPKSDLTKDCKTMRTLRQSGFGPEVAHIWRIKPATYASEAK